MDETFDREIFLFQMKVPTKFENILSEVWLAMAKLMFIGNLALIVVHSIYTGELVQASAAPLVMHMCKCKRVVSCVR